MNRDRLHFLLLNAGHFLDHFFTLIFATVAPPALSREWEMGYGDLLAYATPGFFAIGLFALPAGWLADRWNRDGMMVVFFTGIGLSAMATGVARTPLQIGAGLFPSQPGVSRAKRYRQGSWNEKSRAPAAMIDEIAGDRAQH